MTLHCTEVTASLSFSKLKVHHQVAAHQEVALLQVEYEGLACDQEAAPCGATCNKLLPCGRHRCAERCHHGPCTIACRAMVEKGCACGKTLKVVPCHETFRYAQCAVMMLRRAHMQAMMALEIVHSRLMLS